MNNLDFAKKLLEIGDREGAKKDLEQITSNNPENIDAWFLLAQTLEDKEKKKDCYRQIIRIDPNNRQAQENLKQLIKETNHIEEPDVPEITPDSKKRNWSTSTKISLIIGTICVCIISAGLIISFNSKSKIQIASPAQTRTSTNLNRAQKPTSIPPKSVLYEKNPKSYLPDEHDLPGFKFWPDASVSAPETKFPFGDGYKRFFVKKNAVSGTPVSAQFNVVVLNSEEVAEVIFYDFVEFIKDDSLGITWYLDDEVMLKNGVDKAVLYYGEDTKNSTFIAFTIFRKKNILGSVTAITILKKGITYSEKRLRMATVGFSNILTNNLK